MLGCSLNLFSKMNGIVGNEYDQDRITWQEYREKTYHTLDMYSMYGLYHGHICVTLS